MILASLKNCCLWADSVSGIKDIDEAQAYVNTMDAKTLWDFFIKTDNYNLAKSGAALDGFLPDWIGEFYAYYQRLYNEPSAEIVRKVPVDFLIKVYPGLHDLDLELAVKKVGGNIGLPENL